jgi:hypothetical protein
MNVSWWNGQQAPLWLALNCPLLTTIDLPGTTDASSSLSACAIDTAEADQVPPGERDRWLWQAPAGHVDRACAVKEEPVFYPVPWWRVASTDGLKRFQVLSSSKPHATRTCASTGESTDAMVVSEGRGKDTKFQPAERGIALAGCNVRTALYTLESSTADTRLSREGRFRQT